MTDDPSREAVPEEPATGKSRSTDRLIGIDFDKKSLADRLAAGAQHDREVAIYDLLDENSFALVDRDEGPYKLTLGRMEDRLVFDISDENDNQLVTHVLSFSPLRRIMKDYFLICETYYDAIRTAPPSKIQTLDMGRRGLHDEGSQLLGERLAGKIAVDHSTSRRLFTLICSLYWKV